MFCNPDTTSEPYCWILICHFPYLSKNFCLLKVFNLTYNFTVNKRTLGPSFLQQIPQNDLASLNQLNLHKCCLPDVL